MGIEKQSLQEYIMSQIRIAEKKDFERICHLIKSRKELFLVFPSGSYPLTISQIEKLSEVRMDLSVLTEENIIIGFANFYNYEAKKCIFIGNVIIDKDHRFKGLGKYIVLHMINVAYEKYNLPEVRISVFNENTRALLLYTSLGFLPYDVEDKINFQGDKVAQINMKKIREHGSMGTYEI